MLRFVGCDVHKRTAVFTILLSDGTQFATYTVPVTREALAAFAERQLSGEDRLAMEATTNTWAVAGVLQPFVKEIVVGNPLKVRAIAEAKIKTDKVDSRVLAELLRCDYLPVVWQPDQETQRLRRLTHRRAALVSDRTRLKNRLHSILHHTLVPLPEYDLFSKKGIAWLRQVPLAQEEALARASDLRLLEQTELEIAELDQLLVREAWQDKKVRLVMSIPGIDYTVAQTCLAAIGEVSRFPNAKKLSAYLGLNPSTRQSGPHCYHGPITKQGNAHARWLLVQAAQHLAQYRGPLGQTMRRIVKRKNRNVAVVACARKLAVLLWHVLSSGEPSVMQNRGRCRPSTRGYACVPRGSGEEEGLRRAHRGRRNMGMGGRERCLLFRRCSRKMACPKSPHFQRERESCWIGRGWTPFIANYKRLLASRPTHQPLKSKKRKKILNRS